jgi:protein-tyrosine phosphatase
MKDLTTSKNAPDSTVCIHRRKSRHPSWHLIQTKEVARKLEAEVGLHLLSSTRQGANQKKDKKAAFQKEKRVTTQNMTHRDLPLLNHRLPRHEQLRNRLQSKLK